MSNNLSPPEVPLPDLSGPFQRIITLTNKIAEGINEVDFEGSVVKVKDMEQAYHTLQYNVAALYYFYRALEATGHMDDRWLNKKRETDE